MTRLIYTFLIFCAIQTWADSGFMGSGPSIATPVPSPAPAAPAKNPNFPQCGQRKTARADLAQSMIESVLNIQNPFGRVMVGNSASNSFTLFNSRGELQVRTVIDGSAYDVAGTMCQDHDGLRVELIYDAGVFGGIVKNTIKVKPINERQVHITHIAGEQSFPGGTFSMRTAR